jgi:hypothetical protein
MTESGDKRKDAGSWEAGSWPLGAGMLGAGS